MKTRHPFVRLCSALVYAVLASLTALSAQAQSSVFEKAPPHIDATLRERVTFFFQSHVDGKFRQADSVVHEDSKDAFFVAGKTKYKGFEIGKITYSDDFTKAQVMLTVDTDFFMPPVGKLPVKMPLTTFWKYDQGTWWWYVMPPSEEGKVTPFGIMKPGPEKGSSPHEMIKSMPSADAIRSLIRVDRTDVELRCGESSSEEIIVTNGMQGPVQLRFRPDEAPGFSATVDTTELAGQDKATISFSCAPGSGLEGKKLRAQLSISPTRHEIPITISIVGDASSVEGIAQ